MRRAYTGLPSAVCKGRDRRRWIHLRGRAAIQPPDRRGAGYTWGLPRALDGRREGWGLLLALEAGLAWNVDRDLRLGRGATRVLEPDATSTVLFGVHLVRRIFDV
jgi:hypothetical protein